MIIKSDRTNDFIIIIFFFVVLNTIYKKICMYYMFNVNVNNKKNSANNFHYCFIPIHYKIRKTNYVSYVNIFV